MTSQNYASTTQFVDIFARWCQCHRMHIPQYNVAVSRPRHQTQIVNGAHPGAGARIAYTRHVRASVLPKKETKYSYDAFQAHDRRYKSECDSAVYSSLHGIRGCHLVLFRFFNTKNIKIFI